jgi:hypothetical protein
MSRNRDLPKGGKYTRPRRGYRAKSRYRARLRARGVSPADVRMEPLEYLRKRQGHIPEPTGGTGNQGYADSQGS